MKYLTMLLLLFGLAAAEAKEIGLGIYALPNGWYSVRAQSSVEFKGTPRNQFGNSQVTIRFPKGTMKLVELTSVRMIWEASGIVDYQKDEAGVAYVSFGTLGDSMNIKAGQEVELFRFRNAEKNDITVELLDHSRDKFYLNSLTKEGNSIGNNPGNNLFQVILGEVYDSNYKPSAKQNNLLTELDESDLSIPDSYGLEQNTPNPFNPITTIAYRLKDKGYVELMVYTLTGQLIRTLVAANQDAGHHRIIWDGRDTNGSLVPSGFYIYTLQANSFRQSKKMTLLK